MIDEIRGAELETRVALLEQSLHEIRDNTTKMAGSLQSLTRLEERHVEMSKAVERAFNAIKESRDDQLAIDHRLRLIEKEMPILRIVRYLVFTFCGGCTLIVLMYVAKAIGLWTGTSVPHP